MPIKPVVVAIPIYKETPDKLELISLTQCLKELKKHPIIFFGPRSLNTKFYENVLGKRFNIERFDDNYFSGIPGYNKLMLAPKFYKKFAAYQHILIYQLDAYVFKDELLHWCSAGYDYIGAPWFNAWCVAQPDSEFLGIGNGGFSLRNVKSHLKVLNTFSYIKPAKSIITAFKKQAFSLAAVKQLFLSLTIQNNTFSAFNNYSNNEDIFWGMVAPEKFQAFRVPSMKVASQFSMELNAEMLYKLNDKKLPFGCHAWERYETEFWSKFISFD